MPVRREESGRRSVELTLEVQGTPEQVWDAIATGAGISSWFVRTDVDERAGGSMVFDFGPGLQSPATVTRWEPPRVFAYEEREWLAGAPPVASEFTIEARAGGTCVVRVVHSLFASDGSWDDQLEGFESGWPSFFDVLKSRLSRFAGQPSAVVRVTRALERPVDDAWKALARDLGLEGASVGDRVRSAAGVPALAGTVRRIRAGKHYEALVDIEEPAPGLGLFNAYTWGDRGSLSATLYLFGHRAADTVRREEPAWRSWSEKVEGAAAGAGGAA